MTSDDLLSELIATIDFIAQANIAMNERLTNVEQLLSTTQYMEYIKELRDEQPRIKTLD